MMNDDSQPKEGLSSVTKMMMIITIVTVSLILMSGCFDTQMFTQEEEMFMRIDLNKDAFFASEAGKEKYFVVIMIPTLPRNIATRATIRATWGNISAWDNTDDIPDKYKRIKFMFVVGQYRNKEYEPEFLEEVEREDDIFIFKGMRW